MSIPSKRLTDDSSANASTHPHSGKSPVLPTDRRPPRWLLLFKPKVGIPLAILIVLASIPLAVRSWRISSLPHIDEPFDVEAFCSVTIPDEENAFVEYREAFDLFVEFPNPSPHWNSYWDMVKGDWTDAPPALVAWILSNDRAFDVWLKGTEKPQAIFVQRSDVDFAAIDYTSSGRSLARFALLRVGRHLRDGNTDEAWKILHAAFRFSRHVGQHGIVQERWTGIAILSMVCEGLLSWAHHPNTTADDLDHAIDVLSRDFASMTSPFSETLKYEYLASQNSLRTLGLDSWVFTESSVVDSVLIFVMGEPEYSEMLLKLVLDNQLAGIDEATVKRPSLVAGNDSIFDLPALPGKRISGVELAALQFQISAIGVQTGFPLMGNSLFAFKFEQIIQSAILASLSVEAHVRRHGEFPASLEEFPESFAAGLFTDPCHPSGGNLIYRGNGNFAVIYSLSADGIDDAHSVAPPDDKPPNSWSQLRHKDSMSLEGYRIPLWRPASTDDKAASVGPDNVQD